MSNIDYFIVYYLFGFMVTGFIINEWLRPRAADKLSFGAVLLIISVWPINLILSFIYFISTFKSSGKINYIVSCFKEVVRYFKLWS